MEELGATDTKINGWLLRCIQVDSRQVIVVKLRMVRDKEVWVPVDLW